MNSLKDDSPSGYVRLILINVHVFTCSFQLLAWWKEMLQTKFQKSTSPARAQKSGIVVESPQKQFVQKLSESDLAKCRKHATYLQQTYSSKKWTLSGGDNSLF